MVLDTGELDAVLSLDVVPVGAVTTDVLYTGIGLTAATLIVEDLGDRLG